MPELKKDKIYRIDEVGNLIKIVSVEKNVTRYYFLDEPDIIRKWHYRKYPIDDIQELSILEEELL